MRLSDGEPIGEFAVDALGRGMSYHGGYLYLLDYEKSSSSTARVARKSGACRSDATRTVCSTQQHGTRRGRTAHRGALRVACARRGQCRGIRAGRALVKVGFDGSIADVTEFPATMELPQFLSVYGEAYAIGRDNLFDAFTARFSAKKLLPPSLLPLAGATNAQPPRLAVLQHDFGAGPVRAALRDAAPGSFEYIVPYSDGLTPVSFDKAADLNGNGYEELVVVSRLPAVAEVRDSLDGRLLSTIKLGAHLEPLVATVEQRDGTPPRLAVVARNRETTACCCDPQSRTGTLLASNFDHPGFDPMDVAALPDPAGGDARRYALLARNRTAGAPNKIEVRRGDGNLLGNYWLGSEQDPLQLAVTERGADGLAVLRYAATASDLDVLRIDLATRDRQRVRFSPISRRWRCWNSRFERQRVPAVHRIR